MTTDTEQLVNRLRVPGSWAMNQVDNFTLNKAADMIEQLVRERDEVKTRHCPSCEALARERDEYKDHCDLQKTFSESLMRDLAELKAQNAELLAALHECRESYDMPQRVYVVSNTALKKAGGAK